MIRFAGQDFESRAAVLRWWEGLVVDSACGREEELRSAAAHVGITNPDLDEERVGRALLDAINRQCGRADPSVEG